MEDFERKERFFYKNKKLFSISKSYLSTDVSVDVERKEERERKKKLQFLK